MDNNYKGVMVFCQCRGDEILPVSRQLLAKGKELAIMLKVPLMAAFAGYQIIEKASEAAYMGADKILVLDHEALETYTAEHYTAALEQIVRFAKPEILLIGATETGRDIAAKTAARIGTGLTADCIMLEIQPDDRLLLQTRPAYGGRVTATIICKERRPQMATVREGVFQEPRKVPGGKARIIDLSRLLRIKEQGVCVKSKKIFMADDSAVLLDKARIVVAGGRGMKNARGMSLVRHLAKELEGVVAFSRGAVEEGFAVQDFQVGQTGKVIRPDFYIACGISGASQHMAGIQGAKTIIAINSDREAPIMKMADYVLCADIFQALPELIRIVKEIKDDRGDNYTWLKGRESKE